MTCYEISNGLIHTPIRDSEGRKLPYLQAIIKGGLRILPPVTGPMLKTVPEEGDVLNGICVPGGTDIGYSMLFSNQRKSSARTLPFSSQNDGWELAKLFCKR